MVEISIAGSTVVEILVVGSALVEMSTVGSAVERAAIEFSFSSLDPIFLSSSRGLNMILIVVAATNLKKIV